ncbi:MAG: hypothetical protein HY000_30605 [Planctomycetes bacterium]|nr:hypothetical protein [Planctomycetota bacterium]
MLNRVPLLVVLGTLTVLSRAAHAQQDLQKQLKDTEVGAHWIYNDIAKGFEEAKATDKPLLVMFRCVP